MKEMRYTSISSLESEIKDLIKNKQGFRVLDVGGSMSDSVRAIEREIESQHFKCRIYTAGRIAAAGGAFLSGFVGIAGTSMGIVVQKPYEIVPS